MRKRSCPKSGEVGVTSRQAPGEIAVVSESRRNLVLTVVCLALVLVMAGVAMLNLALPSIARDLGASQSQQQWIIDGYTVVLAALLLPLGALGDRLGRRPMLLTGIAVFGLAHDRDADRAARAVGRRSSDDHAGHAGDDHQRVPC